jgi:hypothetical protein
MFDGPEFCRNCQTLMAFDGTNVWPDHPEDTTLYLMCPECKFKRNHGIDTKNLQGWKNRLRQANIS